MRYKLLKLLPICLLLGFSHAEEKQFDEKTGLVIDDGWELVAGQCTVCHNANLIKDNLQDRNTWLETIRWMQETQNLWSLGDNEPLILDYLSKNYGIDGLEPPRRKNLPVYLLGKPKAEKGVIKVQGDTASQSTASNEPAPTGPEATYKQVCFACHDSGIAGAPKLGDKAAWAPRIATGKEALIQSVLNGKNAMPPRGGASNLSDEDIAGVVQYMMDKAK